METGTTAYQKLDDFYPAFETHMGRMKNVLGRQVDVIQQWLDAAVMYPVGSFEFQTILDRLKSDTKALFEESAEVSTDLSDDMLKLSDVFKTFNEEMIKNVSRSTIRPTNPRTENNR